MSDTVFWLGMLAGLGCALSQSVCYLFSRRYVTRPGHSSWELFGLSHVWMGGMALVLVPVLGSAAAPAPGRWLGPLLATSLAYLLGQVGLFKALRWTDASRVSPLLGLKILMLATITAAGLHVTGLRDLLALRPVNWPQWVAVFASVLAALVLNRAGGRIPAAGLGCILFTCAAYCVSDLSIGVLVQRLRDMGSLRGSMYGCALSYVATGVVGVVLVASQRPLPPWPRWRLAFPVALSWLLAMFFLYVSFRLIGVLFGNIMQSTRGLISIWLASLLVSRNLVHLESRVERGVFWRRLAAALLMLAAIAGFLLTREPGP